MTSLCGFENLMLPETTLYAGNEPLKTTDVERDEDPCSGAVFTDIPIASMADVDAVVSAANAAFHHASWRNLAPLQRERLLHRFADAIEADLPRLAALEARPFFAARKAKSAVSSTLSKSPPRCACSCPRSAR